MGVARQTTMSADWLLFEDWCRSTGVDPTECSGPELDSFTEFVRASPSTDRRRIRNIRAVILSAGGSDPRPPQTIDRSAVSKAAMEVLAAAPVSSWPSGLRGRRDALVVALRGVLGLSRRRIRRIIPADVTISKTRLVSVSGIRVSQTLDAGPCPACAVTRWIRILSQSQRHGWISVKRQMSGQWVEYAHDFDDHDCTRAVLEGWQHSPVLLPPIDRWGWVEDAAATLSVRSLTSIALTMPPQPDLEPNTRATAQPQRSGHWSRKEQVADLAGLDPLFERLDQAIDDALEKTKRALDIAYGGAIMSPHALSRERHSGQ